MKVEVELKGHKNRLLDYLQKNKKITTAEAVEHLGNYRLSEYIRQLRQEGYKIINVNKKGINRYGEEVKFAEFVLVKE